MSTSTKPSSRSEGRKKKIVSVEDKLIAQLSEDIEAERRKWESRHIRYYEQIDRWFFGLGKEKEMTLYPPLPESDENEPLPPEEIGKTNIQNFYADVWKKRDFDRATLELVTNNCSVANEREAESMVKNIDDNEL